MNRSFEQLKDELGRRVGPLLPDVPVDEFEQVIELLALLQCRHDTQRIDEQSDDSRASEGGSTST